MSFSRIAAAGAVSVAVSVSLAAGAVPAIAADAGFYVRADLGASFPADLDSGNWLDPAAGGLGGDLDTGILFGAGAGYAFANGLRVDAVLDHRMALDFSASASDSLGNGGDASADASVLTGLVNIYYDVPLGGAVRPYVGAGLGFARTRLDDVSYTLNGGFLDRETAETQTSFAWALMAGAAVSVTANITVDVGYRYVDAGEIKTSGRFASGATAPALSSELHLHEVTASLRYRF